MIEEVSDVSPEEILRDQKIKILLVRTVFLFLGGLTFLFWPGLSMNIVTVLVGLFLLADGVSSLYLVYRSVGFSDRINWIPKAMQTLLSFLFIARPGGIVKLGVTFLFVLAGIAIVLGVLISILIKAPSERKIDLSSIFFLVVGTLLVFAPFSSAEVFVRIIGGVTALFCVREISSLLKVWKKPISQS